MDAKSFEETQDDRPLLQQLPKYGASVFWSRSRRSTRRRAGPERQIALAVQSRQRGPERVLGRGTTRSTVAQNMRLGDDESSVASVTFTVCPLCLRSCQTGRPLRAHLQSKKHKLSARSTPVSLERAIELATSSFTAEAESKFVPDVVIKASRRSSREAAKKNGAAELPGRGARGPEGMCWEPSKGSDWHAGSCCVHDGLLEKFGDYGVFDINVATPSFLNVEVSEQMRT